MPESPHGDCRTCGGRLVLARPTRTGRRQAYCPRCVSARARERKQAGIGWQPQPVLPRDPMTGYMAEQKRRIKGIEN